MRKYLSTIYYQKSDCKVITVNGIDRLICPKCFDHKQEIELSDYDCKTVIYSDELTEDNKLKLYGQCCCYSLVHE